MADQTDTDGVQGQLELIDGEDGDEGRLDRTNHAWTTGDVCSLIEGLGRNESLGDLAVCLRRSTAAILRMRRRIIVEPDERLKLFLQRLPDDVREIMGKMRQEADMADQRSRSSSAGRSQAEKTPPCHLVGKIQDVTTKIQQIEAIIADERRFDLIDLALRLAATPIPSAVFETLPLSLAEREAVQRFADAIGNVIVIEADPKLPDEPQPPPLEELAERDGG